MSIFSFYSYGQFPEGFEGPTFPPTGWIRFDNGIGLAQQWNETSNAALVHTGAKAAFLNRENVTDGTTALDWLVSPQVLVPTNGQLRFFTRKTQNGNFGSIYTIRISTASQNNPSDFTTIQTWTEATLVTNFNVYEQKVIDLAAYVGQNIFISFVMENDNGDRWLVDDVFVDSKCLPATVQNVSNISDVSVNLGWNNPSGATQWDIEWGPSGFVQGNGTTITGVTTNPYTLTGLTAATSYSFYVRPNCGNFNIGEWFGPFNFTTGICAVASQCDYIFRLTDTFGDGWNGNTMSVRQLGVTVATLGPTFTNGNGPVNITVPLCSGQPFELFWNTGGNFPNEVGVQIIDPLSVTVFTKPPGSGAQNTLLYNGVASCTPPTCPKPTNITFTSVNQTSGTISWSDNTGGNATLWNVIIQPVGTGYPPLGTVPTAVVSTTSYNFNSLTPGTQYEVFISAICNANTIPDPSLYQGPAIFATQISNDNCATATVAPVNENSACLLTVTGTLVGATGSTDANACAGVADDDVWYQFTATSTTHTISLLNIVGSTTNLNHVVYSGSCGTLTQVLCSDPNASTVNGLTIGQVYYIRIYSATGTPNQTSTFNLCIGTPSNCSNAEAFCGDIGLNYTNSINTPSYGSIGCLFTTPNPSWYFMQVQQSGEINFQISQVSTGGNPIDVDYIVWGPFTPAEFATSCNNLHDFPDGNTLIPNNIVSCSYSGNATEVFNITNAVQGNIYIVLITNFSNQQGTVTFTQTGGSGSTNCDIVCTVDLGPNQNICNQQTTTINATTSGATNYQWFFNNVLMVGVNSSSITVSQSGTYKCVLTCGINTVEDSVIVTFNNNIVPTFTPLAAICSGETVPLLPTTSINGIFGTWSPAVISNTNSATYTFTPDPNQCAVPTTLDFVVNQKETPSFTNPGVLCAGSPAISLPTTSGNGFTGTWTLAGNPVTTINTSTPGIFVYTFSPNPSSQCALTTTLSIDISASCTFNSLATAVWIENCENVSTNGSFYNITGSGTNIIGTPANVFPNSYLGDFVQNSGNLVLRGGQLKSFKTATSNVCSARLNYRVYQASAAPGPFTIVNLPLFDDCVAGTFPTGGICSVGDQKWQKVSANGDVVFSPDDLTSLPPGNYIIEVYFDLTGDSNSTTDCDENILVNNSGLNYKANFSISSTPTITSTNPLTCNSSNGTITLTGFTPNNVYSVSYTHNGTSVAAQNYTANTSGTITITGLNAGIYSNFNLVINGCSIVNTFNITLLNPIVTPTFNPVGPFCVNEVVTLPTTSIEAITGSWELNGNPISNIDTSVVGTFTLNFVPNANQCATNLGSITLQVNPIPSVTSVTAPAVCFGNNAVFTISSSPNSTISYTINGGAPIDLVVGASGTEQIIVPNPAVGNVVLLLKDIDNGSCLVVLNSTHTVVVNPIPVATISTQSPIICVGSTALFTITGTPNTTLTYTVNGVLAQPVNIDATGVATIPITSTNNIEVILVNITNNSTSCVGVIAGQVANVTVISVPVATVNLTQPTCAVQTGTVQVTAPLTSMLNTPTNLFISEVTDAQPGNLGYVEIYNGTGASVNLSNYKLKIYLNGNPNPAAGCNLNLSGILANDDVVVIKLSNNANEGGVVPDLTFTACGAYNNNDRVVLTTSTDVVLDVWGTSDGTSFTPSNGVGYNYKRIAIGTTLPSVNWNPGDWVATDWGNPTSTQGDYSDVGSYTLFTTNYEYVLSSGTSSITQSNTVFSGIIPGDYTLVVHDNISNCNSQPYNLTILPPPFNNPVTTISYSTPVCNDNANLVPNTSVSGFTSGGIYSSNPVTGLVINPNTGEINVMASSPNTYEVTYSVLLDAVNCLNPGSSTFNITITPSSPSTFNTITLCQGAINTVLPSSSNEGFTGTWQLGGVPVTTIDTSISGIFTYNFIPTPGQCASIGTLSVTVEAKEIVTFKSVEACIGTQVSFPTISIEGYELQGVWSPSVINNTVAGSTSFSFIPNDICYDEGEFLVSLSACTIPKGFSPNGDGNNDTWDLSSFDIKRVEVYNRYGLKVYSKTSYTNQWSGKSDTGNELPTGTYYFMIEFNDRPSETGWVYINRGE